jgi:hypothetical protein
MARRITTLQDINMGGNRDVTSQYDIIKIVADSLEKITAVANNIDNSLKYLGAGTSEPSERLDGSAVEDGDYYFNTASNSINYYDVHEGLYLAVDPVVILSNTNAAEASKVAAGVSEANAAADLLLTNADVVQTSLDQVQVAADLVQTNADTVTTNMDRAATAADVILVEADKLQTGLDRVATGSDAATTGNDATATAADRVQTGLNRATTLANSSSTAGDATQTALDRAASSADALQTGLDRVVTSADALSTTADATQTAMDRTEVAANLLLTNQDANSTAQDSVGTNADKLATAADLVLTNQATISISNSVVVATNQATNASSSAASALISEDNAASTLASSLPKSGGAMTGAITTNSTFDGRVVGEDGLILDSLNATAGATTKADFDAMREKRIRDGAGSGFSEWGKHYVRSGYPEAVPINSGGLASIEATGGYENKLVFGHNPVSIRSGGISRTHTPLALVNGVEHNVWQSISEGYQQGSNIIFPPAPDGTKSYDTTTGVVVEHASAAEAFEGVITNGDFRDGDDGAWSKTGTVTINTGEAILSVGAFINQSSWVIGENYRCECYVELGSATGGVAFNNGAVFYNFVEGLNVFNFTQTQATTLLFRIQGGTGTARITHIHSMPVTESVITSRQDYAFLESFHEKISEKGVVYPLGNPHFGASTWEGITLSNTVVAQGYSAFGEWDTVTKGYGVTWSTLTEAQKLTFLQDPENNIYSEDGELIQVRYRIRVIEGLGDDWDNINPDTDDYLRPAFSVYINQRGRLTTNTDTGSYSSQRSYLGKHHGSSLLNENGIFSPHFSLTNTNNAHNGLCFAIPIALVQRRNSGVLEPTLNPNGTALFRKTTGGTGISNLNDWYGQEAGNEATSITQCFTDLASGVVGIGRHSSSGDLGGGFSGRSDDKFYDAIYASDVQDLRMSSRRVPVAELREHYKRKAIAGEVRGFEGVPFSRFESFESTNVGLATTSTWVISTLINLTNNGAPSNRADGNVGTVQGDSGAIYVVGSVEVTGSNSVIYLNAQHGDVRTDFTVGNDYVLVNQFEQLHKQANPTWTDIIGDPANIAATFPDGVEGQWIPVVPDGVTTDYSLNRKCLDGSVTSIYSANQGVSWITSVRTIDTTGNLNVAGWATGAVVLYPYETQAHFTEDDVNSEVIELGGVYASMDFKSNRGLLLNSSLIGKIGISSVQHPTYSGVKLNRFITRDDEMSTHADYRPEHDAVVLGSADSPAAKTFDYLSEENGVGKLCYAYKEMIYDSVKGVAVVLTSTADTVKRDGTPYLLNIDGHTLEGHTVAWGGTVSADIDAQTINGYAVGLNSLLYNGAGSTTSFVLWDGNGWGDNNKFEIADNQESFTDDNGNLGVRGTASFNTQYFIDGSN